MFIDNLKIVIPEMHRVYENPYILVILSIFLLIATYTDIKEMKIPNKLNLAFFAVRLLIIPLMGFRLSDIGGAITAFIVLMIPAMIKMHKMGGDIKFLTVLGLYIGFSLVPVFIITTCVVALLWCLLINIKGRKLGNMPFAPFFLATHIILTFITITL